MPGRGVNIPPGKINKTAARAGTRRSASAHTPGLPVPWEWVAGKAGPTHSNRKVTMTAIVGLVHNDCVYLGGDSAGVSGYSLTVRSDPKVFANGPYVMGFTSSFRMGQLLRHAFAPPPVATGDLHGFMVTTFIDAVRECLKSGGWLKKENEREDGGTFLVGIQGRLFGIDDDFQVGEAVDNFTAIGCGHHVALGALAATEDMGIDPVDRIGRALEAAERFSTGVRAPFTVVIEA